MSRPPPQVADVVPPWYSRHLSQLLVVVAVGFFVLLASSTREDRPLQFVPATPRFFIRTACLFPHAAEMSIDYRVEGYSCVQRRYTELDHRPHFPMRPDDKENRFLRVGHLFRHDQTVLRRLDDFLVERHNQRKPPDGIEGPIGGIRMYSLRIPFPGRDEPVERYRRRPFTEYPEEQRKRWYVTKAELREQRCREAQP